MISDKITAVIQARMASTRLPGKSLMPIGDKPMISHVIEFAKQVTNDVILCTTNTRDDDVLSEWARVHSIRCTRGEPLRVLDWFYDATMGKRYIMRICGDNPFLDIELAAELVEYILNYDEVEYVSHGTPGPAIQTKYGLFVEMFTRAALVRMYREHAASMLAQEHVTTPFYQDDSGYSVRLLPVSDEISRAEFKTSVDTHVDLRTAQYIYSQRPNGWRDIIRILQQGGMIQ